MLKFQSFQSGSNGNAYFIQSDQVKILIDLGISCKRAEECLRNIEIDPQSIDGIFVTHEHSDHICGIPNFVKKYGIKVFGTAGTLSAIKIPEERKAYLNGNESFEFGNLKILPFKKSHDAKNPVSYQISDDVYRIAVCTDLGTFDEDIISVLKDLDLLLIESNHDLRMLQTGNYPYFLKRRVMGLEGHLSNDQCAELVNHIKSERLKYLLLGHLSQNHNYPELAYQSIWADCFVKDPSAPEILVAPRTEPTKLITLL